MGEETGNAKGAIDAIKGWILPFTRMFLKWGKKSQVDKAIGSNAGHLLSNGGGKGHGHHGNNMKKKRTLGSRKGGDELDFSTCLGWRGVVGRTGRAGGGG